MGGDGRRSHPRHCGHSSLAGRHRSLTEPASAVRTARLVRLCVPGHRRCCTSTGWVNQQENPRPVGMRPLSERKLTVSKERGLTGCLAESLPVTVPVWFHVEDTEPCIGEKEPGTAPTLHRGDGHVLCPCPSRHNLPAPVHCCCAVRVDRRRPLTDGTPQWDTWVSESLKNPVCGDTGPRGSGWAVHPARRLCGLRVQASLR